MKASRLALCSSLLLCACATPGGTDKGARWVPVEQTPTGPGQRVALVIGIDSFEDTRFTGLKFAARDAEAFASTLEGFSKTVRLSQEETRRPAILGALEGLLRETSSPQDTVVVYVSSHGSLAQRPGAGLERVIVTRDTRMDVLLETGIPVEDLVKALERAPAKRRLLVLALCHSGKGKSQLSDALARALALQKNVALLEARSEATIVLTACAFGETARESDLLGHDVYTNFLVEGMKLGDSDGDGAVTASEAHDYARARTYEFTEGAQRPTAESEVLGIDPIVLRGQRRASGKPVVFSYAHSAEGLAVKVDGRLKGTLPGSVPLEDGAHRLELVDLTRGQTLYSGVVKLEAGERQDLAALLPSPPHAEVAIGGGALGAVGSVRQQVPVGVGVQARFTVAHLLWAPLLLESSVGYYQGAGTASGIGSRLGVLCRELLFEAGVGYRTRLASAVQLDGLLFGGAWWVRRELSAAGFSSVEGTLSPVGGLRARVRLVPEGWPVALAASVEGAVAAPRVDDVSRVSGILSGVLELSFPAEAKQQASEPAPGF
jgi:hypothetical protein